MASQDQFSPQKIFFHTDKLKQVLQGETSFPSVFEISPVGYCNQKCSYCVSQNFRDKLVLSKDQIQEILSQISRLGAVAVTVTGGGEPLLHPHVKFLIEKVRSYNLSLGIITNGTYHNSELPSAIVQNASFCRFSLDTINPFEYKRIRGTNHLNLVIENIAKTVEAKRNYQTNVLIGVQIVWMDQAPDLIEQMVSHFAGSGVDFVQIRPVDNIPFVPNSPSLRIPNDAETFLTSLKSKYEKSNFKVIPSAGKWNEVFSKGIRKTYSGCFGANLTASIGHDFKVYFCCSHIGNPLFAIGDLAQMSLEEVLLSQKRRSLIEGVDHRMCQLQCRNHHLNNSIHTLQQTPLGDALTIVEQESAREKPLHWEFL